MLTGSKRMSAITDTGVSFVLELELGGARFYFGEISQDITNQYGHPTVIRVHGCNLVDTIAKTFDVASDQAGDTSLSISGLKVPVTLPDVFRAGSGEYMVGCRAELRLVRDGGDWGEGWTQAKGIVRNPVLMSTEAVEDTLSFSINQESGARADFPTKDYQVAPGWIDDITAAADPETAFGFDPEDIIGSGLVAAWAALNFLFSTDDVVISLPDSYTDSPQYVPFVFGKPGISGGDSDVELWKDLDGDGFIDNGASFSVGVDERLRYFTTHGQTIATLTLQGTTIDDPDVDNSDGGTKLADVLAVYGFPFAFGTTDINQTDLIKGATDYTFAHQDVCLWARVAIHAGKAVQVGQSIYMVDREHYGTPYSRSGTYTAALGFTARGLPYTYVDIQADYTDFLTLINPADPTDNTYAVYVVESGSSSSFHIFGESIPNLEVEDVNMLWRYCRVCWAITIRAGANTAQFLEAIFSNAEVQRIVELKILTRTWQDVHMSCFNSAMADRLTIKYPTADPLDAHCPGNWTDGGQVFFDGALAEHPAELAMFLFEATGVAYDRGAWFEARDALRGYKLGGFIDDVTDVVDYVTGVLQPFVPFTIAMGSNGLTATAWKWDATKLDACHHFVEGIDLEVVGDGVVLEEGGMIRSLRASARRVTWLHQESSPFATMKPVEDSQLTKHELKKLERLRGKQGISVGWKHGHEAARKLKKFERQLRSTYGSWDFAQDSQITEQEDYWRINNYTGDVESADVGKWTENPLTFPASDVEREQWSRYMPDPLLIAAIRRYATIEREDAALELADVYDLGTLNMVASWIIAARSQPDTRFQGISPKRRGWIREGDVVRVTAPTFGYDDQVCLIVRKGWQSTNVLWEFRPVRLPARDTTPLPVAAVGEVPGASEVEVDPVIIFWTDAEGGETDAEILDQSDYLGICDNTGSTTRTEDWFVSPIRGIIVTGDGGFILEDDVGGPAGATVHSQAFQLGVDPDFWFSWWILAASTPSVTPRVLWCHERTASSYVCLRQKTDGKLEWVINIGSGEVVIVTSTSAVSLVDDTHILINMHGGATTIGLNGTWEASAVDHTDYNGFSSGVGSGSVRFLHAAVSGDNYRGNADDIKAKLGAYFDPVGVGLTYPIPATSP